MSAPREIPHWAIEYGGNPVSYDALYITGHTAPGIVDDIDIDRGFKADEKDGNGVNGGTLTKQGKKIVRVSIRLKLWTKNHLIKAGQLVWSVFEAKKLDEAFDMDHPLLAIHNLRRISVLDVKGPTMPKDGISFLTLDCREWTPQPPKPKGDATKTVASSSASAFTAEDAALLAALEGDRKLMVLHGDDLSKIDERIYNLRQRQKASQSSATKAGAPGAPLPPPIPKP